MFVVGYLTVDHCGISSCLTVQVLMWICGLFYGIGLVCGVVCIDFGLGFDFGGYGGLRWLDIEVS